MLSQEQKKKLRALGNSLGSMIQIGKNGSQENIIRNLDTDLESHELVKISLLKTCEEDPKEAARALASATSAEIVQVIGRTILLYRPSKDNKLGIL